MVLRLSGLPHGAHLLGGDRVCYHISSLIEAVVVVHFETD